MKKSVFSVSSFVMAAFFVVLVLCTVGRGGLEAEAKALPGQTVPACQAKTEIGAGILVSTHGPVEVHAYNVPGDHVGLTTAGEIELGIKGAAYKLMPDNAFVFLPMSGGPYAVDIQALYAGNFDLRISTLNGDQKIAKVVIYKGIKITGQSQISFTLDLGNASPTVMIDAYGTADYVAIDPTWVNVWPTVRSFGVPSGNKSQRCR